MACEVSIDLSATPFHMWRGDHFGETHFYRAFGEVDANRRRYFRYCDGQTHMPTSVQGMDHISPVCTVCLAASIASRAASVYWDFLPWRA